MSESNEPVDRIDPLFDRTSPFLPPEIAEGPPEPVVMDVSARAMRQRTINFAAKRFADMIYVSGLDRATAQHHFRWRPAAIPAGLTGPRAPDEDAMRAVVTAEQAGRLLIETNDADRRVIVRWTDPEFGEPLLAHAIARPGYGGILLGPHPVPHFDPVSIARRAEDVDFDWPFGDAVAKPPPFSQSLQHATDTLFACSPGLYGILIASPERVLFERYSTFGAPERPTPSWSMVKAVTCTLIGRLIHEGWLDSVYAPAPAPLWRDPRAIHHRITINHLLRMRSGLATLAIGVPGLTSNERATLAFENSAVYFDGADAFDAAQRNIVATDPGTVFRYINSGINVLGAIIRDRIARRGQPYHATLYGLLADRLGMTSFQHSADLAGNMIASGSGFATLRDYAKFGVLYLQDGVWGGERLLPPGWADYALTPTHAGASYAACFRVNADRLYPDLPAETAWASGASDQRIMILRRHRRVVAVANETDHPLDHAALNRVIATALDAG